MTIGQGVEQLQLGLFQRHSETSRQAAIGNYPRSGTQRARVLLLLASGPHTDNELVDLTGLSPSSVRPRRVELVEAGLVEDSGQRRKGCVVWATTDEGWLAALDLLRQTPIDTQLFQP